MEIKRKAVGGGILTAFWRGLLVTAVLFVGGILLASALLYSGMVMEEQMLVLLYAVFAAASFGGTAASARSGALATVSAGCFGAGAFFVGSGGGGGAAAGRSCLLAPVGFGCPDGIGSCFGGCAAFWQEEKEEISEKSGNTIEKEISLW